MIDNHLNCIEKQQKKEMIFYFNLSTALHPSSTTVGFEGFLSYCIVTIFYKINSFIVSNGVIKSRL